MDGANIAQMECIQIVDLEVAHDVQRVINHHSIERFARHVYQEHIRQMRRTFVCHVQSIIIQINMQQQNVRHVQKEHQQMTILHRLRVNVRKVVLNVHK